MAGRRLTGRVEALEQAGSEAFAGYQSIWLPRDQNPAEAKASWESVNGPIGSRVAVFWRWPGTAEELRCA